MCEKVFRGQRKAKLFSPSTFARNTYLRDFRANQFGSPTFARNNPQKSVKQPIPFPLEAVRRPADRP